MYVSVDDLHSKGKGVCYLPRVGPRHERVEVPVLDEGEELLHGRQLERIGGEEHDGQAQGLICGQSLL